MTPLLCGMNRADHWAAVSPFVKVVAFGWEDGPTTGVVQCGDCADAYRFDVLATDVGGVYDRAAWDRGEELRVFSQAPLPAGAFDRIVTRISTAEAPTWPTWVPGISQRSPELDRLIETDVAAVLASAGSPTLLVATAGLLEPIVAVRDYPAAAGQAPVDWFGLLGCAAGVRLVAST